jgi:putative endonuclease
MKTHNYKKGHQGENISITFLKNKNYKILQRNYKKSSGEIDIIAEINDTLVFVEVKYRKNLDFGYPKEAVNYKKQQRISKTALWYIKENQRFNQNVRFDVIEIYYDSDNQLVINHYEHAFLIKL